MISVMILINGNPIMGRSAVNTTAKDSNGMTLYRADCGTMVAHNPDDGAVALAHKLLDLLKP